MTNRRNIPYSFQIWATVMWGVCLEVGQKTAVLECSISTTNDATEDHSNICHHVGHPDRMTNCLTLVLTSGGEVKCVNQLLLKTRELGLRLKPTTNGIGLILKFCAQFHFVF